MISRFSDEDGLVDRPLMNTASGNGQRTTESSGQSILVVDDHADVARALTIAIEAVGYEVDIAANPQEALSRLAQRRYSAILLDLNFTAGRTDGDEGLACLTRILADDPSACLVVITAHSGIRLAVAAMQMGARDFVMKPWRNAELISKIQSVVTGTARGFSGRDGEAIAYAQNAPASAVLIGDSTVMVKLRELVRRVGPTAAGAVVTGPPGSGRNLVARALHACSPAAAQEFISLDLRDPLAWDQIEGCSGTVVLHLPDVFDEVAQLRLLHRLAPTARAIAIAEDATKLVPALRSRIATVEIVVPPLRARGTDALLLAKHFVRVFAERHRVAMPALTAAAEQLVLETAWPDEVRGLEMVIERAVVFCTDRSIDAAAIALPAANAVAQEENQPPYDLAHNEKTIIAAALREHHYNVTQAAAALGLSRGALYRRIERYGL